MAEYLEFTETCTRFEAVNKVINVFFDDTNKQIIVVRSSGAMGVTIIGPQPDAILPTFRIQDHGAVMSIKLSADNSVLAVQRTKQSVDLLHFNGREVVGGEFSQQCKRNSKILGFVWTTYTGACHTNELALITDHGIELYAVIGEKRSVKHLKTMTATVQWFVWCPVARMQLLSSAHGSHLLPVAIKMSTLNKLPKLETELGRMSLERDVTLTTIYEVATVLILRHSGSGQPSEIHVYHVHSSGEPSVRRHVLRLGLFGKFAINVVDNLILVHHQTSARTVVFDLSLSGESDGCVTYHTCLVPPRSLKPISILLPGIGAPQRQICELYSPSWVVFLPDIVIDATLGCLWRINVLLPELLQQISPISICTQVALQRNNSKHVLLSILLDNIRSNEPNVLGLVESFNAINVVYRQSVEAQLQSLTAEPAEGPTLLGRAPLPTDEPKAAQTTTQHKSVLINPDDVYKELLKPLLEADSAQLATLDWVLVAYLTSLSEQNLTAPHSLNELLLKTLVRQNKFAEVSQYIQHGVITDSKPLACILLSLSNVHAAASQLAMDMLTRLNAYDDLQEILLSQQHVLAALKLAQNTANPRKFLESAKSSDDPELMHAVLHFLKSHPQHSVVFAKDERLEKYLQHYNELFSKS